MRYSLALLVVLITAATVAQADDAQAKSTDVDTAIERGLDFLVKDAYAWKAEHSCASCHHGALTVWSMREAKQRGLKVDETVLAELTQWIAEGEGRTGVPRPADRPKALNTKAVWFGLALGAGIEPDAATQDGLNRMLNTIIGDQTDNGSWSSWPETRPPIFGDSDERATVLATLALVPAAEKGNDSAKATMDKGVQWLAETESDNDPQTIAMRLVLWQRIGRPADECRTLVDQIRQRQNTDGGWSQTPEMASDAWATGQALFALSQAGIKSDDQAIARGQQFLISTQLENGSWEMTSRPTKPGDKGATSLIPISGAGSAWAVLGLVRTR
jgi:prenyltransferase beta subunit